MNLVSLTLLAETENPQTGGLSFPLKESTTYLFNANRIVSMKVFDTSHTEFEYVFEPNNRQSSGAIFRVTNAYTDIRTASTDEDQLNQHIGISITHDYDGEEITAETRYFNVSDIVLVENDGVHSWVWVSYGGFGLRKFGTTTSLATIVALA